MKVWIVQHMMVDDYVIDAVCASEEIAERERKKLPANGDRGSSWISEHEVVEQ